jgi:ABC-2 type transport system ATP-binding protein
VTAVAAVRASGLVKRFETTIAVDGVDLVVGQGEVRGLLGPNGAGKTTLLRMLFGLVAPDAGEIELLGRPLGPLDEVRLDGVAGFVEEPAFYPYLSGRMNLELLAELDGSARAGGRVAEVLDQVGLSGRGEDRVSGYSTGMRQRLGIAAALLRAPALLLLDEPTSGLDPAGVREVGALLRRLASDGTAVLLSSHLIGEVEGICDSFTVLRRGRVVWSGSAAELRDQAPGSAYRFSTGDDERALELAAGHRGISATRMPTGELRLAARTGSLDAYVLELGQAGVAVRRLELLVSPLESMFFALTSDPEAGTAAPEVLAEQVLVGT